MDNKCRITSELKISTTDPVEKPERVQRGDAETKNETSSLRQKNQETPTDQQTWATVSNFEMENLLLKRK